MPITLTPLRYPGGKTSLYPFIHRLFEINNLKNMTYAEPFAGGAGLALKLLINNDVSNIVINDINPAIFSFWHCVLNRTSELCQMLEDCPVTVDEWYRQKYIMEVHGNGDLLEYGFSTLFLNRTNVSGILKGGIIGGQNQTGKYKIDARFNKRNLIDKIQNISQYKAHIRLFNLDVIDFVPDILTQMDNIFINFDPPYVNKGEELYTNFYTREDHVMLSDIIKNCNSAWMITYDNCDFIQQIYKEFRCGLIPITYSAGNTKKTKEIAVFSDHINLPLELIAIT